MGDDRRGIGGDEGLTFDVTVAGEPDGDRILRFDCFSKTPHYHVGSSPKSPVHDMNAEGIADPVRWTLEQLKTRLPSMVAEAGYAESAKRSTNPRSRRALCGWRKIFSPSFSSAAVKSNFRDEWRPARRRAARRLKV